MLSLIKANKKICDKKRHLIARLREKQNKKSTKENFQKSLKQFEK